MPEPKTYIQVSRLLLHIQEFLGSNLETGDFYWGFLWLSSVCQGRSQNGTWN